MPGRITASVLSAFAIIASVVGASPAVVLDEIATGFASPLFVTNAGDGSGRLFVVEQRGRIRIVSDGAVLEDGFLNVGPTGLDLISPTGGERGLLGLAFHPDYAQNGRLFISYTRREDDASMISEFHRSPDNPNLASPEALAILGPITQPGANHNGGWIGLGPDGYLYLSLGDGEAGGDPNDNGQNLDTLLGKVLRIDVDSGPGHAIPPDNPFAGATPGLDEIFAYGFRNPWRCSFDSATGRLFVADVGEKRREEIDIVSGGDNGGWRVKEGSECFNTEDFFDPLPECDDPPNFLAPIFEYPHEDGNASITGGYVYHGALNPNLADHYIYGDFISGRIWALEEVAPDAWGNNTELADEDFYISSFGEDEAGEICVVDYAGGRVLRVRDTAPPPFDPFPDGVETFDEFDFGATPLGEDFVHRTAPSHANTINSVLNTGLTGDALATLLVGSVSVPEPDGGLVPAQTQDDALESQMLAAYFNSLIPSSYHVPLNLNWVLNADPLVDDAGGTPVLRTPPANPKLAELAAVGTRVIDAVQLAATAVRLTGGNETQTLSGTLNGVPINVAQLIEILDLVNESFDGRVPSGAVRAPGP